MTAPGPRDYIPIHKRLPLLDITDIERRILGFLVAQKTYTWTHEESTPLHVGVALELDASVVSVKRGLVSLVRRGWVHRGIDGRHHQWVQVTAEVTEVCRVAQRHQQVRHWVGSVQWAAHVKHQGDMGEFCERLRAEAMTVSKSSTKKAVQAVSTVIFGTYANQPRIRRWPSVPTLQGRREAVSHRTKSVPKQDRFGPITGPNRSSESGI